MKKKIIALSLAAATLTSMLAGCGGSSSSSGTATVDPNVEIKELDWYLNLSWFIDKWGEDWVSQEIQKTKGFKVNILVPPANGESQKMGTMVTSGQIPDLVTLYWGDQIVSNMIDAKLVQPIDTLAARVAPEFLTNADPALLEWNKRADGHVYGYNCYTTSEAELADPNIYSNDSFWVRKDIYEGIGSPDMSTPDGFLKALRDAKAKYPDSGNGPIIPFGTQTFIPDNNEDGSAGVGHVLQDFLGIPLEKDGKYYDRFTDPEYLKWLKTIRQATQEQLMPADVLADSGTAVEEKLTNGRYFAFSGQWVDLVNPIYLWHKTDPTKAYMAIEGPANSNGAKPTLACGSMNGWLTTMISNTSKNADNAMKFMSYMVSPEGKEMQVAGIKDKTFTKTADGKYEKTAEYKTIYEADPGTAASEVGVGLWAYFVSNADAAAYFQDTTFESTRLVRDMYKPYVTFSGATEFTPFDANSPEGKAAPLVYSLWDVTLPKLLTAKSDAEFDKIYADYVVKRDAQGYKDLMAAKQKQYESNKTKLAAIK